MSFGKYFTTTVVGILLLVSIVRLSLFDDGGPTHSFMQVGNEPATIYLPGPPPGIFEPKTRPAAVVLIHGLSFDRQEMSVLARRIASNGFAVLAIDLPGHGENATTFVDDLGILRDEVRLAVDHLRLSKMVDGTRIVVIGHSMGANAALEYAEHDPALKAVVAISGGISINATRPSNALFLLLNRIRLSFGEGLPAWPLRSPVYQKLNLARSTETLVRATRSKPWKYPESAISR